jgi:starch-binding outer membrane protein, SusD/RagB family
MKCKGNNISKKIAYSNTNRLLIIFTLVLIQVHTSCRKLIDIPPPTGSVSENSVYTTDATAIGVLTGIYISMNGTGSSAPFTGNGSMSC